MLRRLVVVLSLLAPASASSQAVWRSPEPASIVTSPGIAKPRHQLLTISATSNCQACRIEMRRLFTLDRLGDAAIGRDSEIARDSTGRFIVIGEPGPRAAIVDSAGRFVRFIDWSSSRADASARGVTPLTDHGGDIHIFDGARAGIFEGDAKPSWSYGVLDDRLTLDLAPPSLVSLATPRPVARPHASYLTLARRVELSGPMVEDILRREKEKPFPPAIERRFQGDSVISNPACRDCRDALVSVSLGLTKGTLFSATADRYRVNVYDSWGDERPLYGIVVTGGWMPPGDSASYVRGRQMPEAARMTGLEFDANGCERGARAGPAGSSEPCERVLWVAGLVIADSAARDESTRYRTVIDAIAIVAPMRWTGDEYFERRFIRGARMLTRLELPGRVELFGAGLAFQRKQLADGRWTMDVLRLSLRD